MNYSSADLARKGLPSPLNDASTLNLAPDLFSVSLAFFKDRDLDLDQDNVFEALRFFLDFSGEVFLYFGDSLSFFFIEGDFFWIFEPP